jgi:hypothetical protein
VTTNRDSDKGSSDPPGGWLPSSRAGWIALCLWLGAIALFVQFSFASAQELESQAALLGWILVVMLVVGGLTVWSANLHSRDRRR